MLLEDHARRVVADLCSWALQFWRSIWHLRTAGAVLNAAALAGGGAKQSATTAAPEQLQRSMVLASHTMVGLAAAATRGAAGRMARHPSAVEAAVAEAATLGKAPGERGCQVASTCRLTNGSARQKQAPYQSCCIRAPVAWHTPGASRRPSRATRPLQQHCPRATDTEMSAVVSCVQSMTIQKT